MTRTISSLNRFHSCPQSYYHGAAANMATHLTFRTLWPLETAATAAAAWSYSIPLHSGNTNENCDPKASNGSSVAFHSPCQRNGNELALYSCVHLPPNPPVVAINYRIITVVTLSCLCAVQIRKSDPHGISDAKL